MTDERSPRELDVAAPLQSTKLLGAPLRVVFERTLPFEVNEAAFASMLPAIEAAAGGSGQLTQLGPMITWQSRRSNIGRTMQVRFSTGAGVTHVRIEENFGDFAGGLFGGVLGGIGGGLGVGAGTAIASALSSVALAIALPVFVVGTTFVSVRAGYKRYVGRRSAILQQLLDDIERALHRSPPQKQIEEKVSE